MERKILVAGDPYGQIALGWSYDAENVEKWDQRFLAMAEMVASWSKDPSTKCGAVIVDMRRVVVGMGYNGFPRRCDDDPALYANRELKYERVIHAELNAILEAGDRARGSTLYTFPGSNGPSCARCSSHAIQAGIRRVVCFYKPSSDITSRWSESIGIGLKMYEEAGVEVIGYIQPVHFANT